MADVEASIESAIQKIEDEIVNFARISAQLQRLLRDYRKNKEKEAGALTNELLVGRIVEAAGPSGVKLKEIEERLNFVGVDIPRKTISSYLTRAKRRGDVEDYWNQWKSVRMKGGD